MTRFSPIYLLLLFVLPLVWACGSTEGGTDANADDSPATEVPVTDPPPPPVAADPTGENFTINVLDETLKSHRKELIGTIGDASLKINYGSPSVNGRTIYGDLVPYGKVWRTGANEATQITFDNDVLIGAEQKPVAAGTYALFTMPSSKEEWTIIINEGADLWGAYDYKEEQDVARVAGTATPSSTSERMNFSLSDTDVRLHWADLMISFPVVAAAE